MSAHNLYKPDWVYALIIYKVQAKTCERVVKLVETGIIALILYNLSK